VLDLTDPSAPVSIAHHPVGHDVGSRFEMDGELAVGEAENGFYLFRITGPDQVEITARIDVGGPVRDLAITGSRIAVSVEGGQTGLYDIAVDDSVVQSGAVAETGDLALTATLLVVLDEDLETLYPYTLSASRGATAHAPVFSLEAREIALVDEILFVAADLELRRYDLTDPDSPVTLPWLSLPPSPTSLRRGGDWLAAFPEGPVVDVRDPLMPVQVGTLPASTAGIGHAIDSSGRMIAIFDTPAEQQTTFYDLTDPSMPVLGTVWDSLDALVAIEADTAVVAGKRNAVSVIDLSGNEPSLLRKTTVSTVGTAVRDLVIDNTLLYMLETGYGIRIIDISDPVSPFEIDAYLTAADTRQIGFWEDLVLLLTRDSFSILDPEESWAVISETPIPSMRRGVDEALAFAVDGARVAIGQSDGFSVFDLTDPDLPVVVLDQPGDRVDSLALDGDRLWVNGAALVDLTDPAEPMTLDGVDDASGPFAPIGDYGVLGGWNPYACGLRVLDFSEPTSPTWSCQDPNSFSADVLEINGSIFSLATGMFPFEFLGEETIYQRPLMFRTHRVCIDPLAAVLPSWPAEQNLTDLLARLEAGCDWVEE